MKLLIGVLLAVTLISSCNKDDEETATSNYLKIADAEYDLSAGLLENFGTDNWYYGYLGKLILYSKGLSLQIDEENHYEFIGKGDAIYFVLFSSSEDVLDNANYVFTSTEPYSIGTFYEAGYTINFDTEDWDADESDDIVSGTVSISKSGNVYSISINCTGENSEKITGFYEGTLRYFN
ncbi:hypothetical protein OU798_05385 [Prolixibacteraceae bacterium Z1-6]|uniref:Uncharacterized protein n=1 Tax=Draconibacterium aestuarii TaxID=2998507 RepID=A0A9X3F397_9BACT|nr:hypothetical protein [Prolixibacteraceae bacterium Z1-6]